MSQPIIEAILGDIAELKRIAASIQVNCQRQVTSAVPPGFRGTETSVARTRSRSTPDCLSDFRPMVRRLLRSTSVRVQRHLALRIGTKQIALLAVLLKRDRTQRMLPDDLRALTPPLISAHVTPYGTFRLDMSQGLAIEQDAVAV
jgi:hypothetical protein